MICGTTFLTFFRIFKEQSVELQRLRKTDQKTTVKEELKFSQTGPSYLWLFILFCVNLRTAAAFFLEKNLWTS